MTIKVDLLPTERRRFSFDPMMGFLVVIIIIVTVGFVIYGSKLQNDIEDRKSKIAEIDNQIREIERNLPRIETLKAEIAKLRDQIKVVTNLKYDSIRYGNLLVEVGRVLPSNAWLASLAIEPGTQSLTMNGTAARMGGRLPLATIADLMENLNKSPYFKSAQLSSTAQMTLGASALLGFSFQIEAGYDPDAAAGTVPTTATVGSEPVEATAEDVPDREAVEEPVTPEGEAGKGAEAAPEGGDAGKGAEAAPEGGDKGKAGAETEGADTAEVKAGEADASKTE